MSPNVLSILLSFSVAAGLALMPGCRNSPENHTERQEQVVASPPRPAAVRPTVFDYVDSEAFDALFESALINQDPAIVVRTGFPKPDWGGRLNAWIAAWNAGAKKHARTIRGQLPLAAIPGVGVNGETVHEFRLLVSGLMDRIEDLAKTTSAWWSEERIRARRVALLRPYNLRFHRGENGNILLIFFHGGHADYYPGFIQSLTSDADAQDQWTRAVECSECQMMRASHREPPAHLTGLITGR